MLVCLPDCVKSKNQSLIKAKKLQTWNKDVCMGVSWLLEIKSTRLTVGMLWKPQRMTLTSFSS